MFINPEFLEDLSDKDRKAIMSVSGEKLSALAGKAWDAGDNDGYVASKAAGVNVNKLSANDKMAKEFDALTKGMDQEWAKSVADRKVDAQAALKDLRDIAQNYGK